MSDAVVDGPVPATRRTEVRMAGAFGLLALGLPFLVNGTVPLAGRAITVPPDFIGFAFLLAACILANRAFPDIKPAKDIIPVGLVFSFFHQIFEWVRAPAPWIFHDAFIPSGNPFPALAIHLVTAFVVWHLMGMTAAFAREHADESLATHALTGRALFLGLSLVLVLSRLITTLALRPNPFLKITPPTLRVWWATLFVAHLLLILYLAACALRARGHAQRAPAPPDHARAPPPERFA